MSNIKRYHDDAMARAAHLLLGESAHALLRHSRSHASLHAHALSLHAHAMLHTHALSLHASHVLTLQVEKLIKGMKPNT